MPEDLAQTVVILDPPDTPSMVSVAILGLVSLALIGAWLIARRSDRIKRKAAEARNRELAEDRLRKTVARIVTPPPAPRRKGRI